MGRSHSGRNYLTMTEDQRFPIGKFHWPDAVSAEDRDHGFYQKDLKIALDLAPEHVSEVTITPEKRGRFVAICDQFCGSGHGNMKLVINVE